MRDSWNAGLLIAGVAEQQTRWTQNPVSDNSCRCDSCLRHQKLKGVKGSADDGMNENQMWRVYWLAGNPKKKCVYFNGEFDKRRKAAHWCRNHWFEHEDLTIVHPDGTEEPYRDEIMD